MAWYEILNQDIYDMRTKNDRAWPENHSMAVRLFQAQ